MYEHISNEIICPYCDEVFLDSHLYEDEDEVECECGMRFELGVTTETTYHTSANCELNNAEHDWGKP